MPTRWAVYQQLQELATTAQDLGEDVAHITNRIEEIQANLDKLAAQIRALVYSHAELKKLTVYGKPTIHLKVPGQPMTICGTFIASEKDYKIVEGLHKEYNCKKCRRRLRQIMEGKVQKSSKSKIRVK